MAPALVENLNEDNLVSGKAAAVKPTTTVTEPTDGPIPTTVEVVITPEERASGVMSKENVEKAIVALNADGVVVLCNAVDDEALDHLNGPMVEQAK